MIRSDLKKEDLESVLKETIHVTKVVSELIWSFSEYFIQNQSIYLVMDIKDFYQVKNNGF